MKIPADFLMEIKKLTCDINKYHIREYIYNNYVKYFSINLNLQRHCF